MGASSVTAGVLVSKVLLLLQTSRVQFAHWFLCFGGLADCGVACCRDFETVSKDNERTVSEMKALADSFEKEVRQSPVSKHQ